jgi:hypothetical protein
LNKKVLGITVVLMSVVMLASILSTVEACGWRRNKSGLKVDFVFHIENVVRVDDNVRWWTDTGESGTGTPPSTPPEGATKLVAKGHQFVLLGEGTYLQLGDEQIPISPEDYKCTYDVISNYDVEYPVVTELTYFVREKITFNSDGFRGFLIINSHENGPVIVDPESPIGVKFDVSGTCIGYGMINGRFATLKGERHLLTIVPSAVIENSGTIRFFNW